MRRAFLVLCVALGLADVLPAQEPVPYLWFDLDPFLIDYESAGNYEVIELLDGAREAIRERDSSRIRYLYEQLRALDQDSPEYLYAMAKLSFLLHGWEQALRYIEAIPPEFPQAELNILEAVSLHQLGRSMEALAVFDQYLQDHPSSLMIWEWKAGVLASISRFEDAVGVFEEMLALDPAALDHDPELRQIFLDPLAGGPQRLPYRLEKIMKSRLMETVLPPLQAGTFSFLTGGQERGIEILEEALRQYPDRPDLHARLGLFYDAVGRKEDALDHMEKASVLSGKDDPDLLNNRGVLAMYLGNDRAAQDLFLAALKIRPEHAEAYRNLSRLYLRHRKWKDAAAMARASLLNDPESDEARLVVALNSYRLTQYRGTLVDLEPLLDKDTDQAMAWFLAGSAAQSIGRLTDAERYYRKGLALNKDDVLGLNNLADVLLRKPGPDPAALEEALALAERASELTARWNPTVEETLREARMRMEGGIYMPSTSGQGTPGWTTEDLPESAIGQTVDWENLIVLFPESDPVKPGMDNSRRQE